ncbi:DUF3597 domain-containing protein [Microvirga yunnanensis]|uniref:DUF3597 domain-containing protein n=1 Tax=Microvirga yunnanensis TaxID=2953740 RepID=UPI0021C70CCF|nr:DUF3597 domain-containing protein [Microvirga sp. HBU65207]
MSIFSRIKDAIFGGSATAQETPQAPSTSTQPKPGSAAAPGAGGTAVSAPQGSTTSSAPSATPMAQVDVEAVLTDRAAKKGQKLDWRKSIVDLMKLLDLDSSLDARKELAKELNYTGDTSDSATMNIWLHKQVMAKLAASGGKVPDDLRS